MRILFFLGIILPCLLHAQHDQSLSPYFIINADSTGTLPDFPLKLNAADVTISGVIADVKITQVYINKGNRPLEAVYVFPGSTRAAVYAMEMKVGRKNIKAVIREKSVARSEYDDAKQQGKTASLLEQERPNIFRMSVANIMPGDSIVVKLFYTEMIIPENDVYEFVYPTVVGPRYNGKMDTSSVTSPALNKQGSGMPFTKAGIKPDYDFDIRVHMQSPVPFEFITSSSHKILLSFKEKNAATILLSPQEKSGGNRDFILRYKLSGAEIKSGMIATESDGENFFMFMMQPPARVAPDSIPPREYIFVMDVSGSMMGFPIETSKKLLENLISGLKPDDIFNIVLFAGGSEKFKNISVPANKGNIDSALKFIDSKGAGGGTELGAAMNEAMSIPKQAGFSRTIVIATDGYISAEASVFESIHNHLDSANVFAFGIGTSVNRYLIEGIAFAGKGEPFVVGNSESADSAALKFRNYISSPVLTNIKVDFGNMDVYDVEPFHVPDLFAERPIVITGKYHGKPNGNVTVSGMTGKNKFNAIIPLDNVKEDKKNEALKYLWARQKVMLLDYENSFRGNSDSTMIKQITNLGLQYSILTNYTSFIAIYEKVRNKDGAKDSAVTEPLPLPQGVQNAAIGSVAVIAGGTPAMYNTLSGVVNMNSVSVVSSAAIVSYDEVTLSLPQIIYIVPKIMFAGYSQTSAMPLVSDLDRYYSGGMPQRILCNDYHFFFSPQFSSRITNSFPLNMLGSYTNGGIAARESDLFFDSDRQSICSFSRYVNKSSVGLSVTDYGLQELNFEYKWKERTKWSSITKFNERWLGMNVDKNHDSFSDVPKQTGAILMQTFGYNNDEKKLNYFHNSTLVHGSVFQSGQIGNLQDAYLIHDSLSGIYNSSNFSIKLSENRSLVFDASEGFAQRAVHFGNANYFSASSFAAGNICASWYKNSNILSEGISGAYTGGKEIMNGIRSGKDHGEIMGYVSYYYSHNRTGIKSILQVHKDSRFGTWLTPIILTNYNLEHLRFTLLLRRIHGQEITEGSLLPLLYSSKQLHFRGNLASDDGWFGRVFISYERSFKKLNLESSAEYNCIEYNRLALIDLDSHPGFIDVYSGGKQPLRHNFFLNVTTRYTHYTVKAFYKYVICKMNYDIATLSAPLLPKQELCAALYYDLRNVQYDGNEWKFNVTGKYFSPQRLPGHGFSPDFATMDAHAEFSLPNWTFSADVLNAFNYKQKTVVYSSENVLGNNFDASMNWAPVVGRIFQVGVVYRFGKKEE